MYADNSLAETIEITTDAGKYHIGSYRLTVHYIANDASNTIALIEGNGRKALDDIVLPVSEGELMAFSTDLKFMGSPDCRLSIRYNGNGYLYVSGVEITETMDFKTTMLSVVLLIFLWLDIMLLFRVFGKIGGIAGKFDVFISRYTGEIRLPTNLYRALCALFILLAIALRFWKIGILPGNGAINNDEAFAGYEAWSMLHYGYDSHGYVNPVYLTVWGSGMSVLESYVMMPFIALFGLTAFAIRVPSAVLDIFLI